MQNEKCILIKKKFIAYVSTWFSDFLFEGGNSQFYAFRRENAEKLYGIFDEIRKDIDTYVLGYFAKCHEKINKDRDMVITNSYMQAQTVYYGKDVPLFRFWSQYSKVLILILKCGKISI